MVRIAVCLLLVLHDRIKRSQYCFMHQLAGRRGGREGGGALRECVTPKELLKRLEKEKKAETKCYED